MGLQTMAPVDAHEMLKGLSSKLGPEGGIKSTEEVASISKMMKGAKKLVSRCVYINILKATKDDEILEKFISEGGWDILNTWLQEVKADDTFKDGSSVLVELLKVYQSLPITVQLLKQNSCAKTIKGFSKHEDKSVGTLAGEIVDKWMQAIRSKDASSDKSKKKKSKENHEKHKHNKDKHHHHHHHHHHSKSPDKETADKEDGSDSSVSVSSNDSAVKDSAKSRPRTVKTVPTKFRSTGLEQESVLPQAKKKSTSSDKPPVKRVSVAKPSEPPEKRPRPSVTMPTTSSSSSSNRSPSPTEVTHGKIKLIPPRPKPIDVHESSGFIDAITSVPPIPVPRRKRKISNTPNSRSQTSPTSSPTQNKQSGFSQPRAGSASPTHKGAMSPPQQRGAMSPPQHRLAMSAPQLMGASSPPHPKGGMSPTHPERAMSPVEDDKEASPPPPPPPPPAKEAKPVPAQTEEKPLPVPAVPSFYRDTLETPMEEDKKSPEADNKGESEDKEPELMDTEAGKSPTLSEASSSSRSGRPAKGILLVGRKGGKKRVSWVPEDRLHCTRFFELDETERVNVNRFKDFDEIKKYEMMKEKEAMKKIGAEHHQQPVLELRPWKPPPLISDLSAPLAEPGLRSTEKETQRAREQGVLQAIYFSKDMIPDSAAEPDLEVFEPAEPKIIPLEDESGGGETYVQDATATSQSEAAAPQFSLPPDIASLVATMAKESQQQTVVTPTSDATNMANMQSILSQMMGPNGSLPPMMTDDMTAQLKQMLEPFQGQLGEYPSVGPMGPQGPMPLMGIAPPGFPPPNMMRGPPPRGPFPPGGPMMGPPMGMPMGPGMGGPGGPRGPRGPPPGRGGRGVRVPCKHFMSPNGCTYGRKCIFLHSYSGPPPGRGNGPAQKQH